jgi:hypothetical protein
MSAKVTDEQKKLGQLIRALFLMIRELQPANDQNTRRQTAFGERLRAFMEGRETED